MICPFCRSCQNIQSVTEAGISTGRGGTDALQTGGLSAGEPQCVTVQVNLEVVG